MKVYVRNAVMGGVFGIALAIAGHPWTTWQFWLLFPLFLVPVLWERGARS